MLLVSERLDTGFTTLTDVHKGASEEDPDKRVRAIVKRQPFQWSTVKARYRFSHPLVPHDDSVVALGRDRLPPTQHYLQIKKTDAKDWAYLKQYHDQLPMEAIVGRERELLDSHVPIYTAVSKPVFLIQKFSAKFISLAELDLTPPNERLPHQISWLRNPFARTPKFICPDAPSYLYQWSRNVLDNTEMGAWNLISCNPQLFGNVLHDAQESTLDFWWDNSNIAPPSFASIMEEACENAGIGTAKCEKSIEDLEKALTILRSDGEQERGVILQMFVPHAEVNRTVYISGPNGVPDELHPYTLSSLIGIQHRQPDAIPNYETMQVRLMAGRWMNPAIYADFRTYTYTDAPLEKMLQFDLEVERVVRELES
jgi:hypothetical protein